MNNLRLLTRLLAATLLSQGVCAYAQNRQVITIEQLFEIAETNSAMLRPTFSAEDEARHEVSVARSNRLPDINATLSVSYIGDGFTVDRGFSDYQRAPIPHLGNGFAIDITQPIFTGGAITTGIELAELKSTAARYSTEMQRNDIRFQLTGFYLDLYKCGNLLTVIDSNIGQARKMLDEMTARYNQGVALQNDITRYELLLSNLELQRVKINNTLEILNQNLVITAGLPDGTTIVPDSTILARSLPTQGESWWQQEANDNAPSLKLARSGVDISRKAESLVKSERLPKIGLRAGWSIDGPILVEVPPINRNLSYWYVGIGVNYNLASIYKSNKSLAKSRAATVKAKDELLATRDRLHLNVQADYIRYLEAYEELQTQLKSVELADKNYRTISTRYTADMALITDLLDAVNSKIDAEQQLVNARINIIYFYYKLLFTSGKI
ncbi:MAG: TolC family protein [Muribaculaceae bacterium]|nr:TolC family protein [Muribaculaceae bacterium]